MSLAKYHEDLQRLFPGKRCLIMRSGLDPTRDELHVAVNKALKTKSKLNGNVFFHLGYHAERVDENLLPILAHAVTTSTHALLWANRFGNQDIVREKISLKADVLDWILYINPEDYSYFLQKIEKFNRLTKRELLEAYRNSEEGQY